MLKKEFKRKDVNRARNLLMGKTGASTGTQIGYKKEIKEYKEGDDWKEGRKTWTIKDGIKQTVSKLDAVKKAIFMPLCCPNCGNVMKSQYDKPNYRINKKCHDCVVKFEGSLKNRGLYEDYVKNLKGKNNLTILDEAQSYLLDAINTSNSQYVSEDGVIERWVGGLDKEKLTKELKQTIKETKAKIKSRLNDEKRT